MPGSAVLVGGDSSTQRGVDRGKSQRRVSDKKVAASLLQRAPVRLSVHGVVVGGKSEYTSRARDRGCSRWGNRDSVSVEPLGVRSVRRRDGLHVNSLVELVLGKPQAIHCP